MPFVAYDDNPTTFDQTQGTETSVAPKVEPNIAGGGFGQGVRKVSNVLRTIGLGAIPTIGGAAYEVGRSMGGNDAYVDPKTGKEIENPFLGSEELAQRSTVGGGAKRTAQDLAGLASWAVPGGSAETIGGTILAKAGTGFARGSLWQASQADATPGTVLASGAGGAILEPILAGLALIPKVTMAGGIKKYAVNEASKAISKSGAEYNFGEFAKKLTEIPEKNIQAGLKSEARDYVKKIIGEMSPASLKDTETLSTLLGERAKFRGLNYGTAEAVKKEVDKHVKRLISDEIHRIVPATIKPDQAYSAAMNLGNFLKNNWKLITGVGATALAWNIASRLIPKK